MLHCKKKKKKKVSKLCCNLPRFHDYMFSAMHWLTIKNKENDFVTDYFQLFVHN